MSSDRGNSQGSPLPLAPKGKELLMLRSIEIFPQLLSPFFFFPKGWYNSFIAKYPHLCYSVIYTTLSFCSLHFKNLLLLFIGGIVALQYCVSFWCTMKWTSYMYTYIPSLLDLPPQHWPPIQPSHEAGRGAGGGSWSYWNQQEWKLREGTFSVLWCCSFKRIGQTLIVLFCFHSLSFFLNQDMSLITKFHNTMPVGDNGAPVSGQETRKGGAKCTPWYILPLAKCTRKIASGRDSRKRPHKFVFEFLGSPCAGEDQILTNIFCSCSPHFNHILLTFLLYFCLLFLFNSALLFEINFFQRYWAIIDI